MSSVKDVAQNVQHIDGQSLYQVTESDDEIIRTAGADDGIHDDTHVCLFVRQNSTFVQQFLNDVRELLWKGFSYF